MQQASSAQLQTAANTVYLYLRHYQTTATSPARNWSFGSWLAGTSIDNQNISPSYWANMLLLLPLPFEKPVGLRGTFPRSSHSLRKVTFEVFSCFLTSFQYVTLAQTWNKLNSPIWRKLCSFNQKAHLRDCLIRDIFCFNMTLKDLMSKKYTKWQKLSTLPNDPVTSLVWTKNGKRYWRDCISWFQIW